jgi:hypothetical protein
MATHTPYGKYAQVTANKEKAELDKNAAEGGVSGSGLNRPLPDI